MQFKKLFWVRFATVGFPGLASIPMAWYGMGYWALVAGNLVGQFVQVIMLWNMSHWRPHFTFHARIAKEMMRFGAWVGASGLLAWFYIWADSLIVGMYLGAHDLGLYRTGNQFASMIFALLFGPIVSVLYSHLVRIGNDREKMRKLALTVIKTLTIISIPIAMIIYSASTPLGEVIFGAKWHGIGMVIGIMALTQGFAWVVGMNGEFYRAMGKPSYETIATSISLIVYLVAYLYSIQFGLSIFLWTRLGLVFFGVLIHFWAIKKLLSTPLMDIVINFLFITLLSSFSAYSIHELLSDYINGSWEILASGFLLNILALGYLLIYIKRHGVAQVLLKRLGFKMKWPKYNKNKV
jgi:PST family polysaccharide transporter